MKYLFFLFFCFGILSCTTIDPVDVLSDENHNVTLQLNDLQLSDYESTPPIYVPDGTLFYENVPYGDDQKQVLDIFLPKKNIGFSVYQENSVILNIHGGGFVFGDKSDIYQNDNDISAYLKNNIAFVSMNYRLVKNNDPDQSGCLKAFNDSERVLNFFNAFSKQTRIDPTNIFLKGSSSGSGIVQYLISKPEFSARIKGASLVAPQASYDFLKFNYLFSEFNFNLYKYISIQNLENKIINFYGGSHIEQLENDPVIIENRAKILFDNVFDNYNGRLRLVAGNVGIPYESFQTLNTLLHHQIHSIDIYNKALATGITIDAEIPYLNLQNNSSELDFILNTF